MAPKKRQKTISGLKRVNGEWVSDALNFAALPADWSEIEAGQTPEPWLDKMVHLHALRRMAIMADAGAVKLLLSLEGQDRAKQEQILAMVGRDKTADRVDKAVHAAQVFLTICPPRGSAAEPLGKAAAEPRGKAAAELRGQSAAEPQGNATEQRGNAAELRGHAAEPQGNAAEPPRDAPQNGQLGAP